MMKNPNTTKNNMLNELIVTIFKLNTELLEQSDLLVDHLNLTSARWQILGAFARTKRPLTVPQIAKTMGMTRQGVQKQINRLSTEGFCKALMNPEHNRSSLFELTDQGINAFERAMTLSNIWTERLSANLDKKALEIALTTLTHLLDKLVNTDLPQ